MSEMLQLHRYVFYVVLTQSSHLQQLKTIFRLTEMAGPRFGVTLHTRHLSIAKYALILRLC